MMYRAASFFVVFSFAIMGCENPIEIAFQDVSSEIVVIAPFTVDIPWQVSLQGTVNIQDDTPKPSVIENATVKIQGDDGSVVELSHWGGGFYTSPTTFPKVGVTYTLTVEADGYQRVEASDRIPDPTVVRDVRIRKSEIDRRFEIEIEDDGNVKNYYEIAVLYPNFATFPLIVSSPELEEQMRSFAIQDPLLPDVTRPEVNHALIRDTPFNGERYVISLTQLQPPNDDHVEQSVHIRTVSKAYYEYYRSRIIQENANGLPFAEPARILSNIQNGQGIFAGYYLHIHGGTTYQSIRDRLHGSYVATIYYYYDKERGFNSVDYLDLGASIQLTLHPDYSTTGEMRLPPLDSNTTTDQVKVVSLDGGYSIHRYGTDLSYGGYYVLSLYHSSDTILRDIEFVVWRPNSTDPEFSLSSNSSRSFSWAQQSVDRFNGGSITLEKAEK